MKKLKNLVLVYEDGSELKLDLNDIDSAVQSALAAAGLSGPPPDISETNKYLVIQWKDGWQEVVSIDTNTADLLRYYVIRRIEDKGRLALDTGADYPELLVIDRTPMDIGRILIVGSNDEKSYSLEQEIEGYEGTFEAGGKKEYTKFDRDNPRFQSRFSDASINMSEIEKVVSAELKKKKLSPEEILALDRDSRVKEYTGLANAAGIRGLKRQSDVYGFIELLLKRLIAGSYGNSD